jgi:hypothetical protein
MKTETQVILHHNPADDTITAVVLVLTGPGEAYIALRTQDEHYDEESALDELNALAALEEAGPVQDQLPEPEPWWTSLERDYALAV